MENVLFARIDLKGKIYFLIIESKYVLIVVQLNIVRATVKNKIGLLVIVQNANHWVKQIVNSLAFHPNLVDDLDDDLMEII